MDEEFRSVNLTIDQLNSLKSNQLAKAQAIQDKIQQIKTIKGIINTCRFQGNANYLNQNFGFLWFKNLEEK